MLAHRIMTKSVVTVRPDENLRRAANVLSSNGFSALPVVDEQGALVGILSEVDLIRARYGLSLDDISDGDGGDGRALADVPPPDRVDAVMTVPVVAVSHDADIAVVAAEMMKYRRRCIPIVDGDRLVGVITRRDIVRILERTDAAIAHDIRKHLAVLGDPKRWRVTVDRGNVVLDDGAFEESGDGYVALAIAEAVPGVLRAKIGRPDADGDPSE